MIGAGLFVMDPLTTPVAHRSWHGSLHGVFGAPFFFCAPLACFRFVPHFRDAPRWRSLAGFTLGTAVVTIVAAITLLIIVTIERTTGARSPWGGIVQRAHHIPYFIWQAIVAARLAGAGESRIDRHVAGARRREPSGVEQGSPV
jgi:Protein of unknown function (DUF998)